ncbi:MAG: hypothetical protein GXO11_05575 [Epsilonproteobacteria bacterium]|nr:hypothetical protein [Campylobacterota bacterium]
MSKKMYKQALEVIESLLKNVQLSLEEKSRAYYLKGVVLEKMWRDLEAIKAYKNAIEADKNTPWAKLAQSALDILKN